MAQDHRHAERSVHGYFEIDTDIVWDAVERDVPALKPAVDRLLQQLEGQEG